MDMYHLIKQTKVTLVTTCLLGLAMLALPMFVNGEKFHSVIRKFSSFNAADSAANLGVTEQVNGVTSPISGGGTETSFSLPNVGVLSTPTPPIGFNPLTASDGELRAYDFPARPSNLIDLLNWNAAMGSFKADSAPSQILNYSAQTTSKFNVYYGNWSGFTSGTVGTTGNRYVAVKADVVVPSHPGTCSTNNGIGIWVGLGGASSSRGDLAQQGIECGAPLGTGGGFYAFTEILPGNPFLFCAISNWTFAPGDVVYQNMSVEQSLNRVNFFLEDITTGAAHSCHVDNAPGWNFNGDTADYVVEAVNFNGGSPTPLAFGNINFSNSSAQLNSTGLWADFGSQPTDKFFQGSSPSVFCFGPSMIGPDKLTFNVAWHSATCK